MRNNAESKKMSNLEFEQNASGTNFYGIFQDEIPWLGKAIKIYSELHALCKNHCANYCGVCMIRKKIDELVDKMLTEGEFSEQCRTQKDCCSQFKEQIPRRENEVTEKKWSPQHVTLNKFGSNDKAGVSRPLRKRCRYCGLKHRLGSQFCRSFGQRCAVCEGLNHHASVCWFRLSRGDMPKKLSSASGVFEIPCYENERSKCSSTNEDDNDEKISEGQKEQVNSADNIPDTSNIADLGKEVMQTEQISDDESDLSLLSEDEALYWINQKMERNYRNFSQLKNGRALCELVREILKYDLDSNTFWEEFGHILVIEDKEKDISIEKLKCSDSGEMAKLISWLKIRDD